MPAQIPARQHAGVGKESANTSFRCWRIEDELRLAIFLRYRIVAGDHNRTVWIPIRSKAQAECRKIHAESEQRRRHKKEDDCEEDSPEAISQR